MRQSQKVSISKLKKMAVEMLPTDSVVRKLILSEPDELERSELMVKIEIYSKLLYSELNA